MILPRQVKTLLGEALKKIESKSPNLPTIVNFSFSAQIKILSLGLKVEIKADPSKRIIPINTAQTKPFKDTK